MRQRQRIPNFKNLGVIFRTLLLINGSLIVFAFAQSEDFRELTQLALKYSSFTQPIVCISMVLAYICTPYLTCMRYKTATFILWIIILLSASITRIFFEDVLFVENFPAYSKVYILSSSLFLFVLYYFYLIDKAYSPAIQEARIQALQARIRPHFLFNCINAVLSLIRHQPQQAETALQDMADLFRVFMADNRHLVPLSREIALCKQYCALEKCRLEDRLRVDWEIQESAMHVLVPSLILQPLLENAVYHGIEPLLDGGVIHIHISLDHQVLHIRIINPVFNKAESHHGNQMAIQNIKERLNLHFDLEATLHIKRSETEFQTQITLPIKTSHSNTFGEEV